jgi:hypothetical protein
VGTILFTMTDREALDPLGDQARVPGNATPAPDPTRLFGKALSRKTAGGQELLVAYGRDQEQE